MCRNGCLKTLACQGLLEALIDSVSVHLKSAHVEKMPLNFHTQKNAGTACVSECVLKTLACRGLHVGPSIRRCPSTVSCTVPNCESANFWWIPSCPQDGVHITKSKRGECIPLFFWAPPSLKEGGLAQNILKKMLAAKGVLQPHIKKVENLLKRH